MNIIISFFFDLKYKWAAIDQKYANGEKSLKSLDAEEWLSSDSQVIVFVEETLKRLYERQSRIFVGDVKNVSKIDTIAIYWQLTTFGKLFYPFGFQIEKFLHYRQQHLHWLLHWPDVATNYPIELPA